MESPPADRSKLHDARNLEASTVFAGEPGSLVGELHNRDQGSRMARFDSWFTSYLFRARAAMTALLPSGRRARLAQRTANFALFVTRDDQDHVTFAELARRATVASGGSAAIINAAEELVREAEVAPTHRMRALDLLRVAENFRNTWRRGAREG